MRPSRRLPPALLLLGSLAAVAGCAEVRTFGAAAIEKRRSLNDMQARATMAATCDIALGAYFRELSEAERRYVGLVCGGMFPPGSPPDPTAGKAERPRLMPMPTIRYIMTK